MKACFHKYFNTALLQNSKVKVHNIQKNINEQDIKMTKAKDSKNFAWNL
jgi:hypothetical protein